MVTPVKNRLLNILLADDGSLNARAAVQLLADLPHSRETVVTALRVFTPVQATEMAVVEGALEKTKNLLRSRHLRVHPELVLGYPAQKIIDYAEEHHPDLVVVGAKGLRSVPDVLLGGVAMHIVEDGRWPVLVVREPLPKGLKRILLVTDGSPCSQMACDYVGVFPLPADADVTVMHVVPPMRPSYFVEPTGMALSILSPEDEKRIREEDEQFGRDVLRRACDALAAHGLKPEPVLRTGDAADQILNFVKEERVDLIVAGSRGLGTLASWLMGSVSRKLVHYAKCSVLIVRCASAEQKT
jgi:nucleotide-binding universal stress UspA family protein